MLELRTLQISKPAYTGDAKDARCEFFTVDRVTLRGKAVQYEVAPGPDGVNRLLSRLDVEAVSSRLRSFGPWTERWKAPLRLRVSK
ncbi:hypothetical protein GCM10009743_24630 [Kribbella swartbergensis]